MRWNSKPRPKKEEGALRVRRRFLLLPKNIQGEWRWLERAQWTEQGELMCGEYIPGVGMFPTFKWVPIAWGGEEKP